VPTTDIRDRNKEVPHLDMLQTLFEYAIRIWYMVEPNKPRMKESSIEGKEGQEEGQEDDEDDSMGQTRNRS
jgi:hypothetical protein